MLRLHDDRTGRAEPLPAGPGLRVQVLNATGPRIMVVTDNDKANGDGLAEKLGMELYGLRNELAMEMVDTNSGIDQALSAHAAHSSKPGVIADVWDNPGGGVAGDGTVVLRRLIERRIHKLGVALPEARILEAEWAVSADVWSVTSWVELRRDGLRTLDANLLHPDAEPRVPYLTRKLAGAEGPVVATTDYVSEVPDQVRQFVPNPWATLGADGHGFSDTRAAARRYFLIDGPSMVVATLSALERRGEYRKGAAAEAAEKYQLHDVRAGSSGNAGGES